MQTDTLLIENADLGRALLLSVLLVLWACVALVLYLAGGQGISRLAQQQGIKYAWLAWVPVARYHLFGAVADKSGKDTVKPPLRWLMPGVSLLSLLIGGRDWLHALAGSASADLSVAAFVRLWMGSPLHGVVQIMLALVSALAVYRILLQQGWKQASLWAALCLPLWFLRWPLLWLAVRPKPQQPPPPAPPNPQTTGEWQQAMEQVLQNRENQ